MSNVIPTDLGDIEAVLRAATRSVEAQQARTNPPPEGPSGPGELARQLDHLLDLAHRVETPGGAAVEGDRAALAEQAPALLEGLDGWLGRLGLGALRDGLDRGAAGLAVWLVRKGATLTRLEPFIDALARVANRIREPAALATLSDLMGEVLGGVTAPPRAGPVSRHPRDPWRLLNLNHGIVATRSHDPQRMEAAFATLVRNLPGDAAAFFQEGMGQMEALSYPPEVRAVMERYYRDWSARTLH